MIVTGRRALGNTLISATALVMVALLGGGCEETQYLCAPAQKSVTFTLGECGPGCNNTTIYFEWNEKVGNTWWEWPVEPWKVNPPYGFQVIPNRPWEFCRTVYFNQPGEYRLRFMCPPASNDFVVCQYVTAIGMDVTPSAATVCADCGCAVRFSLTNNCTPHGVTWSVSPANGVTLTPDGESATVTPNGTATGVYTITATSVDNTNCLKTATLTVIRVGLDVDSNNDLEITDSDDGVEDSESFVFWLNRDRDLEDDWEFDWPSDNIDTDNEEIDGVADLEDMAMLSITLSKGAFPSGTKLYLKFDASSGAPSIRMFEKEGDGKEYITTPSVASGLNDDPAWELADASTIIDATKREIDFSDFTDNVPKDFIFEGISAGEGTLSLICEVDGLEVCRDTVLVRLVDIYQANPTLYSIANFRPGSSGGWEHNNTDSSKSSYTVFVHGYNVPEDRAKDSWFPTIYTRLYWSGHEGNFVGLTWEGNETDIDPLYEYNENVFNALSVASNIASFLHNLHTSTGKRIDVMAHSLGNMVVSQASKGLTSGDVEHYVLCQGAVPGNSYDSTVPRWDYVANTNVTTWIDGFPLNADGTLNVDDVEVDPGVDDEDDLWVSYMASAVPNVGCVNTYSMADGVLGGAVWGNNEKWKPTTVKVADRDSNLPWSREWAILAYRFPGRSRCAGHVSIPAMTQNHDVQGEGINSHSALRERPIQDVWDFFSYLVDRGYVVGTSQR